MIKTEIDSSNLIRRFKKFDRNIDTFPWLKVGDEVENSVKENFDAGGKPDKWIPRKVTQPWPVLIKTGRLRNSIYVEKIKDGVTVGTRVSYQAVHIFGYPQGNIPARPFLLVQDEDIKETKKKLVKHIFKK